MLTLFGLSSGKLSFSPVDVNNSEGHLYFEMQAHTIDNIILSVLP